MAKIVWCVALSAAFCLAGAPASEHAPEPSTPVAEKDAPEPPDAEKTASEPPPIIRTPTPTGPAEREPEATTEADVLGEVAGYAQLARNAVDAAKWPLADYFIEQLVNLAATDEEKADALMEIGKTYEANQAFSKAIAIYEKVGKWFGRQAEEPERLLQLGRLYRQTGAPELAISRFYNVLNASLMTNRRQLGPSQSLTRRAQAEIAETYFAMGNFSQAQRFYELLARLELPAEESARVHFRLAHCLYLLGEVPKAGDAAQKFLEEFPDDASAPECRYLLASVLRDLKQPKEAHEQVLALLREQQTRKDKAPETWNFWQKKAGNEFANHLYQSGDYLNALAIYQALAALNQSPDWMWPVVYQMGLCFEKLRLERRAAEAYKYILDQSALPERKLAEQPANVRNLVEMARWRGDQLVWQQGTGTQVERVLGPNSAATAAPVLSALIPFR